MIIRIVIPFAGDEDLLKETILSVASQVSPNWELYILDNASGGAELKKWISDLNNKKIIYQRNTENIGMTANFNLAKELLGNHWGVILGADDVLGSNFVGVAINLVQKFPEVSFVQVRTRVIGTNGQKRHSLIDTFKFIVSPKLYNKPYKGRKALTRLLIGNWLYFPGIVWNPKSVRDIEFDKNLKYCLDLPFEVILLQKEKKIVISKEIEFNYRRHDLSISNNPQTYIDRLEEERLIYKVFTSRFSFFHNPIHKLLSVLRFSNRLQLVMNFQRYLNEFGIKAVLIAVFKN